MGDVEAEAAHRTWTLPSCPGPNFTHGLQVRSPFETVTAAFYHHAALHPNAIAARDLSQEAPRQITYQQLALRATCLGRELTELGVGQGDRVPLIVKRSIDMLTGILAILSCGAQYVPLDGGIASDATVDYVILQTQAKVALCLKSTEHRLAAFNQRIKIRTIEDQEDKGTAGGEPPIYLDFAKADGGCYVIYTSGTTGVPKGVDVTHSNVTNLICLSPGNLGIRPGTKVGQVLNIGFDMAAWEILGCLCNGGTLIIRGPDWEKTLQEVNVLICTPSILSRYAPATFPNLNVVATAGEPSTQRLADLWAANGVYYNCCGPTEASIVNTIRKHTPGRPLSIGVPTPNNIVYILDKIGNPVMTGERGIMWAAGAGVSRGYLGLPEMTKERYQVDPFANDGSMMFNTGDICRWREDGELEIFGRIDDQVKIKGFRVELEGLAAYLSRAPGVVRAVALLVDGKIHAFIAPKTCNVEVVGKFLESQLPYYAIPERIHLLDTLPTTDNGKIHKGQLRELALSVELQEPVPKVEIAALPDSGVCPSPSTGEGDLASSSQSSIGDMNEKPDIRNDIPDKDLKQPLRGLVHRVFIVYRRLFTIVTISNLAAFIVVFLSGRRREWCGIVTASNLTLAVLIRQDFVINLLYFITCSVPKTWPLFIRKRCAKIYHLGGVHSAAAVWAGLWLLGTNVFDVVCGIQSCPLEVRRSTASQVVSWMISALFMVMFASAWPDFRKKRHNYFEKFHRFTGWTMLVLFWVLTVLSIYDARGDLSLGRACVRSPSFWLLVVATLSIASSWVTLRKVKVDAEVLSDHAVRLHFDYTIPVNGTFTRLSRRPLLEWHSFATIPEPHARDGHPPGYSLVVSNAGDWTKDCIKRPPTKIWVRGIPTCGVMRIATLFNRIVIIATGSGIGPLLGHIQHPTCATQLIWSTPKPHTTFGPGMLKTIRAKIPNAVIHDTKVLGRPDLVKMGYNLAKSFRAEAVIIIANEKITKKIVYGLETRGVPAYGAIWDS